MLEVTRVTISPNLPLIGKDLDVGATLNADVTGAQPDLLKGTIMRYDPVTQEMQKIAAAGDITGGTFTIGILAADSYQSEDLTTNRPAMIWRRGTFLRSTVNEVNGDPGAPPFILPPIIPGDPVSIALADVGIFLEESWDDNALGIPPV